MKKVIVLYIKLHPSEWRLFPWIRTLNDIEELGPTHQGGWRFTWIFIRLERHKFALSGQ